MSLADRFKSERERLALTQPRVADLAGVGKTTVINWEKGLSSPTAVQLSALAEVGLDVLYVITGQRSKPLEPAQELPRQEQEWLALYRNSSEEVRAALKAAGNELTKPAKARGKAA